MSRKHVAPPQPLEPALRASKAQLLEQYRKSATAIRTLTAAVHMLPTAGSALTGVIEQYHEVNGYILAARPASIRVIGQAPIVAKDIFDMVSDGRNFRIYIPSKNKFITGPTTLEREAKKPIENLRPQHLFEALLWSGIAAGQPVLLEQNDAPPKRYYVLIVAKDSSGDWALDRKIWFDRSDLNVSRIQIYHSGGLVVSDIRYGDWQRFGHFNYPRDIDVSRPVDDYQLRIRITQLTLDQPISADRFHLAQPPGTELVRLGKGKQP